jgi:hypothetical protein
MPFDMGFDFRGTLAWVTDPAYGVWASSDGSGVPQYPHTFTNANGQSINAGCEGAGLAPEDLNAAWDPRIAGNAYQQNTGVEARFRVDLGSGSAPGSGVYSIDLAMGHVAAAIQDFAVYDDATPLIDGTNGGAGLATAASHWRDATLTDVAATTTWTGTPATKTFATLMVIVKFSMHNIGDYSTIGHFRLTQLTIGTAVLAQPEVYTFPRLPMRAAISPWVT